jgi:hypothetical protein
VSEDFPAFIVNRILLPMINEAIYTLYEGVGSVEAIDTAMKLGANHPMGPLELADFIGLDTCLSIMQVLHDGLSDSKYRPCPLLVKYVEAGWLGRKSGRGFYDYRGEKRRCRRAKKSGGGPARPWGSQGRYGTPRHRGGGCPPPGKPSLATRPAARCAIRHRLARRPARLPGTRFRSPNDRRKTETTACCSKAPTPMSPKRT